VKLKIGPMAKK